MLPSPMSRDVATPHGRSRVSQKRGVTTDVAFPVSGSPNGGGFGGRRIYGWER